MQDFCVVGSAPSAIAAAEALTRRGLSVIMLDAGRSLDPGRRAVVARLEATEPDQWDPADIRSIKEGIAASANGIPLKRLSGSDFPLDTPLKIKYANAGAQPSHARGG